jgi:two-component system nitrogen regulation sensor histidine kinase GlnL
MLAARDPSDADLIAALPVATLAIGPDDRIARVNAEAETLLNMSQRTLLGRRLDEVLTGASGTARRSDHAAAIFDTAVTTARGLSLRVDLVEAEMPERPGWRVLTLHNVAPSRRLGQGIDRAAAARSAVGAAAMLAHEIKNPLSSIRGAAQLIADGAAADELCGLVIKEVDRIAALIDRMEDFTDTRPRAVSAINIYPLLAHARDVALAGFARGIMVEERYDPSLPLVLGNHDALLQVMLNLLKNAAAALGSIGERRITLATAYRHGITVAAKDGGRVALPIEICVIDTGPGAPEDIAEHLFDPFVSGNPEGKGLGLALVDKLIRDMGGLVQYTREGTPHATVFRILLPRAS